MKKWIAIVLACALCLTGCVRNLDNIPALLLVEEYGEDWALEKLEGYSRWALREIWGDPQLEQGDGFGDVWFLDEAGEERITVRYDEADKVTRVLKTVPGQEGVPYPDESGADTQPPSDEPTCVAPPEPTEAALLSHPPQLHVACGGEEVRTLNGGFSWVTENGILCADALHPLQLREYVTDYVCAQTVQDWAVLQFTDVEGGFLVYPEQVSARAWEEDCTPTCDCLSTDVSVENLSMQLLPGGYVYEVIARWGDGETGGGVTTHMFWVNKLYPGNE